MRSKLLVKLTILPIVAVLLVGANFMNVQAGDLPNRSVAINTSVVGATADYEFSFINTSNASIGAISFEFCRNSPLFVVPCVTPVGLDTTGASLTAQSGETGFTGNFTTNGRFVLSRTPTVTGSSQTTYRIDDIINPSDLGTVYVRIGTYPNTTGNGPQTDSAAVAYSTANQINISGFVPPRLEFCAAADIFTVDCSNPIGSFLDFGELGEDVTGTEEANFAVTTNAFTGYAVSLIGTTLTSGNKIIDRLETPTASQRGVNQFGVNLRDNSSPNFGRDIQGTGSGFVLPDYNTPNLFKFETGDTVAQSPLSSAFNNFTMAFIANVDEDQDPGIYSTTLTVLAVATF